MNARVGSLAALALLGVALHSTFGPLGAQSAAAVALGGTASSAAEGAMSGVLVSWKICRQFVVQCWDKDCFTRGKLLQSEVGGGVKVSNEDHGVVITPLLVYEL